MARTVRNPLENRTPVRTISSVMRNAPRQNFRPTQLDFGDVPEYGYGRPDRGIGQRTPINQAVTSTLRPAGGVTQGTTVRPTASGMTKPAASVTAAGAKAPTAAKAPVTSTMKATKPAAVTKPAATKTTTTAKTTPAVKTTPATKPAVKPITSTTTKPTTPAVKPITTTTKPTTTVTKPTTTTTKPSSSLTSTLLKTAAGAGTGALLSKLLTGGTKTGTAGTAKTTGTAGATTRPSGIPTSVVKPSTTTKPSTTATKPTSGVTAKTATAGSAATAGMTDEEIQAELDRVKASEEAAGIPEGAVANADGTYSVTEDGMTTTYGADGSIIGMEAADTTTAGEGADTTVAGGDNTGMTDLGEGYFQDASGNIYSASGDLMYAVGEDGSYYDPSGDLIYDPNADTTASGEDTSADTTVANNTWTDPDSGETWLLGDDGLWNLEGDTTDYTLTDDTENTDDTVVAEDNTDDSDEDIVESKRGGSIHTKGGLPRFADGDSVYSDTTEEVQPWQNVNYNYGELDDPTLTGYTLTGDINPVGNTYARAASLSDIASGDSMDGNAVDFTDNGDGTASYWDGNEYVTVDSDTGNELYRTDDSGNIIDSGNQNVVTSAGSGNQQSYAAAQAAAQRLAGGNQGGGNDAGILDALKGYITQNPGLAGGAIGALISSLMDQAQSGDSAGPSQPVDISALTSFGPRTTDFGPGMTGGRTGTGSPIVSYADYAEGYGDEVPDDRLYSDLGISGWLREPDMSDYRDESGNLTDRFGNPVDEMGYLLDDGSGATEEEIPEEDMAEVEEEPAMAAGGPTTHYTFGRVIDPAESLGLAQGMKKGGLSQAHTVHSHHTNPVIDNRVDFRQGSAVNGAGDGQSDDIPAWLADGEYVMDAELVSMLGNGSNKAGAKVLDKFREEIRAHKRSAPLGKIPPKAKSPLNYLKEAMNG